MLNIDDISLRDLVPESIRSDPKVSAAIDALDGEIRLVSELCRVPSIYARIDELDDTILDHLAWQYDARVWRDNWPIELKRSVIRQVVLEKSKLGTRSAINEAVVSFGSAVAIREWWETSPQGVPHTFDVTVTLNTLGGEVPEAELQEDVIRRIQEVKPVRSQFTFTVAASAEGAVAFFGVARGVQYQRLEFTQKDELVVISSLSFIG